MICPRLHKAETIDAIEVLSGGAFAQSREVAILTAHAHLSAARQLLESRPTPADPVWPCRMPWNTRVEASGPLELLWQIHRLFPPLTVTEGASGFRGLHRFIHLV
jgi:hypothetical protein